MQWHVGSGSSFEGAVVRKLTPIPPQRLLESGTDIRTVQDLLESTFILNGKPLG